MKHKINKFVIAKNEEDWHAIRGKGLGGSDVGTVLGLNPYKSAFELWEEKTAKTPPKDLSDNLAVQVGHAMEDFVAKQFSKATGLQVIRDNKTYIHEQYDYLLANIDRRIVGQRAFLECKTTSVYNAKQWDGDNVPDSYLLQVQHYLNVLDYDVAYIAVLIGNTQFKYKKIERDQELIDLITPKLVEFWTRNVLENQPPQIDGTQSCADYINNKYRDEIENDTEIELSKQYIEACRLVTEYKGIINQTKTLMTEQENIIKTYMGDNRAVKALSNDYTVSWKEQNSTRVDTAKLKKEYPSVYDECTKTTTTRVFRLKENNQ